MAAGAATTDTKCQTCSKGRFRSTSPTTGKAETEDDVCQVHKTCAAGEWTGAKGTPGSDTKCKACSAGRYRGSAPDGKSKEVENEVCEGCAGESMYSDQAGLTQCKKCPNGHFGVVTSGSDADGGHTACDDDTCERPTKLPANSVVVDSNCPDHGKQKNTHDTDASSQNASTCVLSCKDGFYSSGVNKPFTCLADDDLTTASYQGGNITCAGKCVYMFVWHLAQCCLL